MRSRSLSVEAGSGETEGARQNNMAADEGQGKAGRKAAWQPMGASGQDCMVADEDQDMRAGLRTPILYSSTTSKLWHSSYVRW